jgi:endonuclease/exonuclease/phosphatase (EEP) superfamily protein YafD
MAIKIVTFVLGYCLIIISLIPLIRKDNWVFRIFEYPRSQKLFINLILLISFFFIIDSDNTYDLVFGSAMLVNFIYLFYQVWPYTVLGSYQLKKTKKSDADRTFTLYISNVYQDNRDVESCLRSIRQHDPDIILLVETDHWWKEQLDPLVDKYSYVVSKPLNNTYGILLYSRLRLLDTEIKFLVKADIPSVHCKIELPTGERIRFYGLHPQPPVPQESARSTERDAEILMVAKEAKASRLPVIVAGDLNDVAWSYTTELFLKVSGLLDPRRGRGFFNTFHAHHWFLRWPLDHVFCSKHFELIDLKRLPAVGSDHFPILISLQLAKEIARENVKEMMHATAEEKKVAGEKIAKATA